MLVIRCVVSVDVVSSCTVVRGHVNVSYLGAGHVESVGRMLKVKVNYSFSEDEKFDVYHGT